MKVVIPAPDRDRPDNCRDGYDWFGCYWRFDNQTQGYVQPLDRPFPLTDLCKWREQVKFPDLDALDWEEGSRKDLEGHDASKYLLQIRTESGPFERLHQLYGFENAFIAMYDEPEAFLELMGALADFRIRLFRKIAQYYPADLMLTMDDLGSSRGPLMSLDMYRRFIKPFDARIIQALRDLGVFVVYHSCGSMEAFIPDIIEMGADIINPLQGGINDQKSVEAEYGDRIIVSNGLDNIVHLPSTTEDELRAEVRRVMDIFWEKKNLIVLPNSYVPGYPDIILDEAKKFNMSRRQGEGG